MELDSLSSRSCKFRPNGYLDLTKLFKVSCPFLQVLGTMVRPLPLGLYDAYLLSASTVDDLSYSPTEEERARDENQLIATGRRSWKTLKDKDGEAVWPPNVYAFRLFYLALSQPVSIGKRHSLKVASLPYQLFTSLICLSSATTLCSATSYKASSRPTTKDLI